MSSKIIYRNDEVLIFNFYLDIIFTGKIGNSDMGDLFFFRAYGEISKI